MLEAEGFPEQKGALMRVAEHLKMPHQTLSRWFREKNNPPPPELVQEKRGDLIGMIRAEIEAVLREANAARADTAWRDLMVGLGILVDKLQLLSGAPTESSRQVIKIERDSEDFDTFAHFTQRTNGSGHHGAPVQLRSNGAAVGQNGVGPKG